MALYSKSLLYLKPTYELVISKMLFSLGYAVAIVGLPLYFIQIGLTDSQIGIVAGIISLSIAVLFLYMPPILERFNQRKLLICGAFVGSLSFAIFGLTENAMLSVVFLAFGQISLHISSSALSVLFKDSTRSLQEFTKDTGLLGSFTNLGWFVGPLLGGLVLNVAGFKAVFAVAASFIMLAGLYVLLFPFKTVQKKRSKLDTSVKENLRFYLSSPQLRIAYLQRLGIDLWWGFIWTFIPIFMIRGGYGGAAIGLFIALTQLPLFLLEFKTVGIIAKYGLRRVFIFSYLSLMLISVASFFFFDSHLIVVLGLILAGSLALSFLEPISDIFFYSKVSIMEEEKAYPMYATAAPVGSTIAKIVPGLTLLVFYDRAVFVVIGLVMLFIAYKAFAIKD